MTGAKNRSGKVSTVEQARVRAAVSAKGGAAFAARHRSDKPIETDTSFAGPFESIADYDKRLGPVMSWSDVAKRETVIGLILANEATAIENQIAAGALLTVEQVAARDAAWNAAADQGAAETERLLEGIPEITPEQRKAFLERTRAWRAEFGARLSKVQT